MALWACGDVHGNIASFEAICRRLVKEDPEAIVFQVGDMGVGFRGVKMPELPPNCYFIAGNHDDALVCQTSPYFLGDYGCREFAGKKVFWLGGAKSTDRQYRTEGIDWWAYEELTEDQFAKAIALYEAEKPDIVITHECPRQARERFFEYRDYGLTVQALTMMHTLHQPEFWCFGHHHRFRADEIEGTYFMCLEELQNKKIKRQKPAWDENE